MAERDKASQVAIGVSAAAAITAAIALSKKAKAAPPGIPEEAIQLPQELWNLIIAIANSIDRVDTDLDSVIDAIKSLSLEGGLGWPPNAEGTRSFAVLCVAAATPYQASDMEIPDGMALLIKSSPFNAIASVIFVARTPAECTNPNSAWPLALNESVPYFVKNANAFFVSTNVPGSIAVFTAEQRS